MDDAALEAVRRAGFTFVRLPLETGLLAASDALEDAIARVQRHRLAVVVVLFAGDWQLETDRTDRTRLIAAWRRLASTLRQFDPIATFPEVLNEPVFRDDPAAWSDLQHQATATIRAILPSNTIILTGANWGSVAGLLSLQPEPDPNVVYSFHLYDPPELTALGAYRTDLDAGSMARLPFPVVDRASCEAVSNSAGKRATADVIKFYCAQGWDVAKVDARIAEADAWAQRHRVAVLAGEFGASQRLNAPARLAWLAAVRDACEQRRIGWALWGYDDSMGFAMRPPGDRRAIAPDVLAALGLTH
jgi:hypothetical protein